MPVPLASYVPILRTGNMVFLSGHVPFKEDMKTLHQGKVGVDYTTEEAAAIAEWIGLELTSTLKAELGDLDKVFLTLPHPAPPYPTLPHPTAP